MISDKKAQGLSMNVIVISVIALIVLVVIVFIFSSKISLFGKGVSACKGDCVNKDTNPYNSCDETKILKKGYTYDPSAVCTDSSGKENGRACCIKAIDYT